MDKLKKRKNTLKNVRYLPEVTVTAPKKWFVGYDDKANPIYTTDYKQSQEYLQNQLPVGNTEQNRRRWAFENVGSNRQVRPGLHGDAADLAKAAQLGIGTALTPLAAGPLVETSMPVMEAMTPGSSFWMNPITQQMVTGTAMSEGVNLANKAVSGYNSVGEGIGDLIERGTGWNPNNTWWGSFITEAFNPGWYWNPNSVMNTVGRVGNVAEQVIKDAATTARSYLTHPTYQTVYHGSPYAFNVKDFHKGTPYDLGLHVGPKDMAVSAGQEFGSEDNVLYKLRIPQADTETIDIGRNGVRHLSEDLVWGKHPYIKGWENMGYSFLSSNNKLLPKWLDEAGAKLTIKPDDYRGYRMWTENDAHINLREKAFPNISKDDRVVADRLLEDAKQYENVFNWEKAPQEMREGMSKINEEAADLLSRNGYKVIKYFNNNEAEGAANAFIVTDPSVIDVMPDMSLSKYRNIWKNYQPIFRESLPFTGITRTPVVKATIPQITPENAASITPEQWTAAQDAAIARGDMAEALRLRDLHFKVSAPNSVTHEVFHHGNKKPMNWYTFDPKRVGTTDEGYSGAGYYFAPTRPASQYAKEHFSRTLGPHGEQNAGLSGGRYHRYVYLNGETKYKPLADHNWTTHTDFPFVDNRPIEVVVGDNRQIKLVDAVTYDDKGVRIPLGERDNFSLNDIRYGLLPFISLRTLGTMYGTSKKSKGGKINKLKYLRYG